jgi:hypothetical protein
MEYLHPGKDWKYKVKSSAITFFSVFLPFFAFEVMQYDLSGIKPEDVTLASAFGLVVMVLRLAAIAVVKSCASLIQKFK